MDVRTLAACIFVLAAISWSMRTLWSFDVSQARGEDLEEFLGQRAFVTALAVPTWLGVFAALVREAWLRLRKKSPSPPSA